MSDSVLYEIRSDGDVAPFEHFHNSYRAGILIWATFAVKYGLADRDTRFKFMTNMDDAQKVWDLAKRDDLPRHEKIVMLVTFDHYAVRSEDFGELAFALRQFHKELPSEDKYCHTNSWADAIERLPKDTIGCAFQQTSVAENLWWVHTGEDEGRHYNVFRDKGHHWVFEELNKHA